LIGFLTPYANDGIGYAFGFVFFACNFLAAGIVYFFLFETRSLSLESVDMMYSDSTIKPLTSKKWVPPGYINRMERDEAYWHRRQAFWKPRSTTRKTARLSVVCRCIANMLVTKCACREIAHCRRDGSRV
jgi:hypothetical protein